MVTTATKWVIVISYTCFCWFILTPLICISAWKFYNYRHSIIIQKRYVPLMFVYSIFVLLSCVERPFYFLQQTLFTDDQTFGYIAGVTMICVSYPLQWFLLLKYWLIYFLVNWIKITLNKTWQTHLNPRTVEQNWYLRKRSTFGNLSWTLKRLCLSFVFFMAPPIILGHQSIEFLTYWTSIWLTVCTFAMFYLIFKIRRFEDDFYIVLELKIVTIVVLCATILWTLIGMLPFLGVDVFFQLFFGGLVGIVAVVFNYYIQTWYIVRLMARPEHMLLFVVDHSSRDRKEASLEQHTDDIKHHSNSQLSTSLQQVLSEEVKFESFMQHSAREWSMENMLSFIELTQLQQTIKKAFFAENDQVRLSEVQQWLMDNQSVPDSYIVYHSSVSELLTENNVNLQTADAIDFDSKMVELKIKSYMLYRKYIVNESQLQINVSYQQRQALHALMSDADTFITKANLKEMEVFQIYTDVVTELQKLLKQTYYRYALAAQKLEYSTTIRPESPRSKSVTPEVGTNLHIS